jgi:hypothetical protein
MHPISVMCLSVILVAGGSPQKTVSKSDVMTATATVQAIDSTNRVITLRSEDGTEDAMYVPNDVTRFDQVKVGDKLRSVITNPWCFSFANPGRRRTSRVTPRRLREHQARNQAPRCPDR